MRTLGEERANCPHRERTRGKQAVPMVFYGLQRLMSGDEKELHRQNHRCTTVIAEIGRSAQSNSPISLARFAKFLYVNKYAEIQSASEAAVRDAILAARSIGIRRVPSGAHLTLCSSDGESPPPLRADRAGAAEYRGARSCAGKRSWLPASSELMIFRDRVIRGAATGSSGHHHFFGRHLHGEPEGARPRVRCSSFSPRPTRLVKAPPRHGAGLIINWDRATTA